MSKADVRAKRNASEEKSKLIFQFAINRILYLGSSPRKPVFGVYEQHRPARASSQSDQHLCYSLFEKYKIKNLLQVKFRFLASLCSLEEWFESRFVRNPKDRFSRDEAHLV